jgi:beta-propeller repeat-containing protein
VSKLNPAGSALVYSTYLGGSDYEEGYSIAVDGTGNAYVTGTTSSSFPLANPLQPTFGAATSTPL